MRFIKILLGGLVLSGVVALCFPLISGATETLTIAGTGDSQQLLRRLSQVFHQQHPDVQILVPDSVGSGGGIKLLLAGRSDLARIARPLKPKEQADGLQHRLFAYSAIVFVANLPEPCLTSISAAEVRKIYLGTLNNWSRLGTCKEHKIYVANRENGDSSRSVIERLIPGMAEIKQPAGRTIYSTPEAYDTLNRYPYSFGYLPESQLQKDALTTLNFEGLSTAAENIQTGRYRLVVPLGIVWRGEATGATKQFLDFLTTSAAHEVMLKMHAVPVLN